VNYCQLLRGNEFLVFEFFGVDESNERIAEKKIVFGIVEPSHFVEVSLQVFCGDSMPGPEDLSAFAAVSTGWIDPSLGALGFAKDSAGATRIERWHCQTRRTGVSALHVKNPTLAQRTH
jgi:hypothetical protein